MGVEIVSGQVPEGTTAVLDALAKKHKVSRSQVICRLLLKGLGVKQKDAERGRFTIVMDKLDW